MAAMVLVRVFDETAVAVVRALLIVKLNVCEAVPPSVSVTVTVYSAAAVASVGVPVIAPVVVLLVRPEGNVEPE